MRSISPLRKNPTAAVREMIQSRISSTGSRVDTQQHGLQQGLQARVMKSTQVSSSDRRRDRALLHLRPSRRHLKIIGLSFLWERSSAQCLSRVSLGKTFILPTYFHSNHEFFFFATTLRPTIFHQVVFSWDVTGISLAVSEQAWTTHPEMDLRHSDVLPRCL